MIKALTTGPDGKTLLVIGLSFGNLDRFRAQPGDTFIKIEGAELGLPMDVLIFSGETETKMTEYLPIGPQTNVKIDKGFKQ